MVFNRAVQYQKSKLLLIVKICSTFVKRNIIPVGHNRAYTINRISIIILNVVFLVYDTLPLKCFINSRKKFYRIQND